jgi:hypothetical protein
MSRFCFSFETMTFVGNIECHTLDQLEQFRSVAFFCRHFDQFGYTAAYPQADSWITVARQITTLHMTNLEKHVHESPIQRIFKLDEVAPKSELTAQGVMSSLHIKIHFKHLTLRSLDQKDSSAASRGSQCPGML